MLPEIPAVAHEERANGDVATRVYYVLIAGMATSVSLYVAGLARLLWRGDQIAIDEASFAFQPRVFLHDLVRAEPAALFLLATVILVFTPIARVAIATFTFHREGDRVFARISATVLLVVALAIVLSRFGLS